MAIREKGLFLCVKITIELHCPNCQSAKIKKNGKKSYSNKQNYYCKSCHRQFIGDYFLKNKGCCSLLIKRILLMLVRGLGIRDICEIEGISAKKLVNSNKIITPKYHYYPALEVDEFWTYIGNKQEKHWLIYAYDRETKEIVAYVWGKRDVKTAMKLRQKLLELGVEFGSVCTDNWDSFAVAFRNDNHIAGKQHTVGIEGNNCLLRHRIRRAFRKTCCFSKKLINHLKAFELAFFYINYGHI